jgi:hypothetical protein
MSNGQSATEDDRVIALERRVAQLARLQGIGDFTANPDPVARSGVSNQCSGNSNGCQIIIRAPSSQD